MFTSSFPPQDEERVYRPPHSTQGAVAAWTVGGVLLLAVAVVGFAAAAFTRMDRFVGQAIAQIPLMLALGAFASARMAAGSPSEVGVGPGGLRVVRRGACRTYAWNEIGWCLFDLAPLNSRKRLQIFDLQGRPLVTIGDDVEDLEALADAVTARVGAAESGAGERIRLTKARRSAITVGLGGTAFLALSITVALITRAELQSARLLETSAVPGQGVIVRRFVAPNRVTRRVEYRITSEGRSANHNVQVEPDYWQQLAGAATVPALYVPGRPDISRLVRGQVKERKGYDTPIIGYGMPAVLGLISLMFIFAAVLQWQGRDLDMDSKTGKISIKAYGTGR